MSTCTAIDWSIIVGEDATLNLGWSVGGNWVIEQQADFRGRATTAWGRITDVAALDPQFRFGAWVTDDDERGGVGSIHVACSADADGDGLGAAIDCDDGDPLHQLDCARCVDMDGDGRGQFCDLGFDCDDTDPNIHGGVADTTVNGVDENCDGIDGAPLFLATFDSGLGVGDWLAVSGDAAATSLRGFLSPGALSLPGNSVTSAAVTSRTIDASSCINVAWSYVGLRESPTANTELTLTIVRGVNRTVVDVVPEAGAYDDVFKPRSGVLPPLGPSAVSVQLELSANGKPYYVDDVALGCAP